MNYPYIGRNAQGQQVLFTEPNTGYPLTPESYTMQVNITAEELGNQTVVIDEIQFLPDNTKVILKG